MRIETRRPLWFEWWPLSILSYGRALRVLDAAVASVGAIVEAIAVHRPSNSEDESLHRIEVEGILDTLEREMPSFASPISRSVRNQWRDITEAEKKPDGSNSELTAGAKALHRVLEAQRRSLVASAPAFSPSALPKTSSLPPPQTPTEVEIIKPDQPQAFKPDEAALLAGLIDKFYGSSAFKVIGGALVAAALLAGAGTVYLGTHTLTLRDDLEKTEAKAKSDIKDSAKNIQDSITAQSTLLKAADDAIMRAREEFKQNVDASEMQIKKVVDDFSAKSATLRDDAIRAAIATLDSQLKDPVSTLSNAINEKTKHMDTLSKDVETLEERRAAIDDVLKGAERALPALKRLEKEEPQLDALIRNFDDIKAKEKGISDTLQSADGTVQRIKEGVPKLDTIIRELKDMEAKEKALSEALTNAKTRADDAGSHAQAAKQSASLAETARGTVMSAVEMLQKEAASQELSLGGTRTRIEGLTKDVVEAETKFRNDGLVASDVVALKQKISALTSHVDDLRARLQKLEQPPKAPPPSLPQSQAELSPQQWFEIQQNLAARGFNPGKVDGRPGNNTRQAIRLFQGATNQPVTGILTAAQIEQILTRP